MSLVLGVLAALFVLFLLVAVTVKNPRFGAILSTISIILIALAVYFYTREGERIQVLQSRIAPEEIVISDPKYQLSYGNFYQLTARIENRSDRYMLYSVTLGVAVYHCPDNQQDINQCQLLEQVNHRVETRLPATKSTAIDTYIPFDNLPVNNDNLLWQITIASSIGK